MENNDEFFAEQDDDICPRCQSDDVVLDHVTLKFDINTMMDGSMQALGVTEREHENFPILRCQNCGNIAMSRAALVKIIPALEEQSFDLVRMPNSFGRAHELN